MSLGECQNQCIDTIGVERFTELIVHGFNSTEVFMEILLHFLGQKCLLFREVLIFTENFHGTLENRKNEKVQPCEPFTVYNSTFSVAQACPHNTLYLD